jgi:hypothetical protein
MIAIGAIAIGVFLGTSLAPAALAMGFFNPFFPRSTQSITQTNMCSNSSCSNSASNNANFFPFSSSQSITQANACSNSQCTNIASNTIR